ncbi:MAG: hypothetical protein RIR24_719 [Actinomycetota bacterium]|jgi:hypothetical protein
MPEWILMATKRSSRNAPPALPNGEVLADFSQYSEAVAYVEKLVRNDFPAGFIAIVGSDLRSVERVRGRMSYARVAFSGAVLGSWIGLIYAFLFGPAIDPANIAADVSGTLGSAIVIGAGIGMLFNVLRFSLARNKREFVSQSSIVAAKYQVQVPGNMLAQANEAAAKVEPSTKR